MHAHHCDSSIAAAIFVNGTYFVDMPRILNTGYAYGSITDIMKLIKIE
jgi:hypothetical protein